ncbi:hypothetical protein [Burkholderia sp. Ac-20344]|uniref:hypothetical protein n=1 Tax=Burkholderia sp. Ac-20344 TaxID=2703890 RepID=UPI00197C4265|nr:hypothetical protein [Burkholderia sp. Ac-20344]MBN3831696.1 hypothetical protein [Burkholderia sp. Ac-20344]
MKHIKISVLAAGLCVVVGANAATTIPKQFQGDWASNCKQATTPQNTEAAMSIVRTDRTTVSYGEAQCTLLKMSTIDASHINGTFDCKGDGVGRKEVLSLKIDGGKLRLVDRAGNIWQSTDELSRCN